MTPLAQQADQVRRGQLDPTAIVEEHLERIDAIEPSVGAWVIVDRAGALAQAKRIAERVKAGNASGNLLGAIIGVKDIVDVTGLPTRSGAAWTDTKPVAKDAPLVEGLRRQGAIILGKTVTTELACFDPPKTRHPTFPDRTPGGSSSGSAAAVASRMCQAAVGSQTGGSITRPASFCGVAGLKPTFGVVSTKQVTPVSEHLDHPGPIAACVADLFDCFQAMADCRPFRTLPDEPLEQTAGLRAGRIDSYFQENASAELWSVYSNGLSHLNVCQTVSLPDSFAELHLMHRRLMVADAAHAHYSAWRKYSDQFASGIASLIEEGLATTKEQYLEASKHWIRFRRDVMDCFEDADVLVTPATVTTAPTAETTGDPSFNSPWSYCGLPTISVPCGCDADGLAVSLQLIARPHCEGQLAAYARWCEAMLANTAR